MITPDGDFAGCNLRMVRGLPGIVARNVLWQCVGVMLDIIGAFGLLSRRAFTQGGLCTAWRVSFHRHRCDRHKTSNARAPALALDYTFLTPHGSRIFRMSTYRLLRGLFALTAFALCGCNTVLLHPSGAVAAQQGHLLSSPRC